MSLKDFEFDLNSYKEFDGRKRQGDGENVKDMVRETERKKQRDR